MEYLFNWRKGYQELWKAVIRPPRAEYNLEDLGPKKFLVGKFRGFREDLIITNNRNQDLHCSWFKRNSLKKPGASSPVVVYLHGNSSSRLEALQNVTQLLSQGISLFCFDFAGCGLSDGEYISLGHYESQDLKVIIEYLRNRSEVSQIGLWGRSMGAVTSLMFADQDPGLAAIVVDSPFCSLNELAKQLALKKAKIPNFVSGAALSWIRKTIKEKHNFDIENLNPLKNNVGKSLSPAFFISAKKDELIPPSHAKQLHDKYKGQKRYMLVEGTHNSEREEYVQDAIIIFFYNCFGLDFVAMAKQKEMEQLRDRLKCERKTMEMQSLTEKLKREREQREKEKSSEMKALTEKLRREREEREKKAGGSTVPVGGEGGLQVDMSWVGGGRDMSVESSRIRKREALMNRRVEDMSEREQIEYAMLLSLQKK